MREPQTIFLILVVITCIISAGCVQSSGNSSVTPAVATSVPTLDPVTIVPTTTATSAPREVVTVIRYVSPLKDVKDSYLLFTLQVPVEWNLVADNVFSIDTYVITRGREQEYRDRFRQWIPEPVETTVTINDIRYDRFESRACGNTSVAYIAHTNSANERGYASVLVFTARDSNRFEKEDFEKVVSSFRYFSMKSAGAIPGEEIPVYDLSGNAVSRNLNPMLFNSSDWDSAGGSSIDLGSPGGGSSNEGSPGGGTCPSGSTITVG